MKKNLSKITIISVLLVLLVPTVAFASWWNPFTWNWFFLKKDKHKEEKILPPEDVSFSEQEAIYGVAEDVENLRKDNEKLRLELSKKVDKRVPPKESEVCVGLKRQISDIHKKYELIDIKNRNDGTELREKRSALNSYLRQIGDEYRGKNFDITKDFEYNKKLEEYEIVIDKIKILSIEEESVEDSFTKEITPVVDTADKAGCILG